MDMHHGIQTKGIIWILSQNLTVTVINFENFEFNFEISVKKKIFQATTDFHTDMYK